MKTKSDGEVLKQLRTYRKLTQLECCQGIISRHTYSKIERNQTGIQVQILVELLERLHVSYDDFLFLKMGGQTPEFYRKKCAEYTRENLLHDYPQKLYDTLEKKKEQSIKHFHDYLFCKKRMNELDVEKIERISESDLNQLHSYINRLTFFSTIDLTLFSDMCTFLTYKTAKYAGSKIIEQLDDFSDYLSLTQAYQQAFHQALTTMTSVALNNNDYLFVQLLLKKTKEFIFYFPSHYYLVNFHLNTDILNYKQTENNYYLTKLFVLKDYMKILEDHSLADKIEEQIKTLLQQTASLPTNQSK
ncbi:MULTISPECIES: helix-turn-helix domain-containing protein [unclassified Enterococcus]|uniref:helix-turn-helix domain-containing protein n=1 Tax=unclassified Enterococcus TaxID=2608891 RepID=UPI001CE06D8E|nr:MULTISPECIES: helix-turn-helix transcriptional regulator [unclassified Enterococcus]MCA5012993.1 helix-turn-helix transcriptional regulator [Enterococcus sp. S23]MCA5016244.1 helix-turn-helix transcriptional regulator [Enterococcus sp. S22(2020)]